MVAWPRSVHSNNRCDNGDSWTTINGQFMRIIPPYRAVEPDPIALSLHKNVNAGKFHRKLGDT